MSNFTIVRDKTKKPYGKIDYQGKTYILSCCHPWEILKDENLSWESKGYLSYLLTVDNDVNFSSSSIQNLIEAGYAVEVQE